MPRERVREEQRTGGGDKRKKEDRRLKKILERGSRVRAQGQRGAEGGVLEGGGIKGKRKWNRGTVCRKGEKGI